MYVPAHVDARGFLESVGPTDLNSECQMRTWPQVPSPLGRLTTSPFLFFPPRNTLFLAVLVSEPEGGNAQACLGPLGFNLGVTWAVSFCYLSP